MNSESPLDFDLDLLDESPIDSTYFTVKNYSASQSNLQKVTDSKSKLHIVKGPMGKSLQVESTGEYIAFASGTGVLRFLDLIAHLALTNLRILNDEGEPNDVI